MAPSIGDIIRGSVEEGTPRGADANIAQMIAAMQLLSKSGEAIGDFSRWWADRPIRAQQRADALRDLEYNAYLRGEITVDQLTDKENVIKAQQLETHAWETGQEGSIKRIGRIGLKDPKASQDANFTAFQADLKEEIADQLHRIDVRHGFKQASSSKEQKQYLNRVKEQFPGALTPLVIKGLQDKAKGVEDPDPLVNFVTDIYAGDKGALEDVLANTFMKEKEEGIDTGGIIPSPAAKSVIGEDPAAYESLFMYMNKEKTIDEFENQWGGMDSVFPPRKIGSKTFYYNPLARKYQTKNERDMWEVDYPGEKEALFSSRFRGESTDVPYDAANKEASLRALGVPERQIKEDRLTQQNDTVKVNIPGYGGLSRKIKSYIDAIPDVASQLPEIFGETSQQINDYVAKYAGDYADKKLNELNSHSTKDIVPSLKSEIEKKIKSTKIGRDLLKSQRELDQESAGTRQKQRQTKPSGLSTLDFLEAVVPSIAMNTYKDAKDWWHSPLFTVGGNPQYEEAQKNMDSIRSYPDGYFPSSVRNDQFNGIGPSIIGETYETAPSKSGNADKARALYNAMLDRGLSEAQWRNQSSTREDPFGGLGPSISKDDNGVLLLKDMLIKGLTTPHAYDENKFMELTPSASSDSFGPSIARDPEAAKLLMDMYMKSVYR
jgi:hypothetical protein